MMYAAARASNAVVVAGRCQRAKPAARLAKPADSDNSAGIKFDQNRTHPTGNTDAQASFPEQPQE
jgi:hypothetical protein